MFLRSCMTGMVLALTSLPLTGAEDLTVKAVPAEVDEIKVDGVLDEPVWTRAEEHGNFTVYRHPEKTASEQTTFKAAASRNGLYFAFDVTDSDIAASAMDFDGLIEREDVLELFITADDPIPDDPNVHNCRQLLFSPAGVRADLTYLGGISERKWTCDWLVAVKRNERGYTAELFLPYYALEIVNIRTRKFHFNIARENTTGGKRELSVWRPAPRFSSLEHFGTLELPFDDFSAFQRHLDDLEFKSVPAHGKTEHILTGTISGGKPEEITLQATARFNGKIAAVNRCTVKTDDNSGTPFRIPLYVNASGTYGITVTGRTKEGKILHHICELELEAVPFKLKWANPVYRRSIFPDQKDKILRVSVDYQTEDGRLPDGIRTLFTVTDSSGKVMASGTEGSGAVRTFTADVSAWPPGDYLLTAESTGHEALRGTLRETFRVLAPPAAGNSVRVGPDRMMYLNGKRFFPRGFLCGDNRKAEFFAEMSEAGYNVIHFYTLNQMKPEVIKFILDEAQKHDLKVFCYPYYRCKVSSFAFRPLATKIKSPRLTEDDWNNLKTWVNQVKSHPSFLGWYLCDEPKGAEFCAELRKVYQTLKEIDPHHPVICLDMTADGCIAKRDGYADVHILDMYPHPLARGGWLRSISSVLNSMKLVSEGVKPLGAWFCPEAFKPNSKEYRSISYREIRCLIFGSIINGATGIVPYKIGDPSVKYYQKGENGGIFSSPDMHLGYLKGIGPELKALESVLLEPERLPVESGSRYIIAMRKRHNGKEFIFAVNIMPDELKASFSGRDLPDGEYRVLGENRTVTVKDGKFTDPFIGYMTHIYTSDPAFSSGVDIAALEEEIRQAEAACASK